MLEEFLEPSKVTFEGKSVDPNETRLSDIISSEVNKKADIGIVGIPFLQPVEIPLFPVSLFVFSLFAMLPYGAGLAAARLLRNRVEKRKFKEEAGKTCDPKLVRIFLASMEEVKGILSAYKTIATFTKKGM